jgi:hypothetical protein
MNASTAKSTTATHTDGNGRLIIVINALHRVSREGPNAVLRGEPLAASPLENTVMHGD